MNVNLLLILLTSVTSVLAFSNTIMFDKLKLNAYRVYHNKEVWRMFSSGFLHAGYIHLFFNMWVLFMFGEPIEEFFISLYNNELKGKLIYLIFYLTALPVSSIFSVEKNKNDIFYNAVGASGAVTAVLFAFIILSPFSSLYLMFIPIPIPAIVFGILYLIYTVYMGKRGTDNIGHDAHFFGAMYGIAFIGFTYPEAFPSLMDKVKVVLGV